LERLHRRKQERNPRTARIKQQGASVLDRQLSNLEKEFVPAADAMGEDKYEFTPTNGEFKGVRTFAQQIKHVAATNLVIVAALLQEKPPLIPSWRIVLTS
jgi:hypothetical protein